LLDDVVEALGEIQGWLQDAAEVRGDVSVEKFGEGAVALEALPDDLAVLVLFDELAGEGGFADAARSVDEDEAEVVFDPGLELGEFGGAPIEGEEGWGIKEVFGECSIELLTFWISLTIDGDVRANIKAADLYKSV
jgi:hypothetical protein